MIVMRMVFEKFQNVGKTTSEHGRVRGDVGAHGELFALLRGSAYIFALTSTQSGKSQQGLFPYREVAWQPGESRSRRKVRARSRLGSLAN